MSDDENGDAVQVVFMRHGESEWNGENLFCGWVDVGLSATGIEEARRAGKSIRASGLAFDLAFTSVLTRALTTTELILDEVCGARPDARPEVRPSWQLSERHYGALTGKNKAQMVAEYGEEQVQIWRRAYDVRPPPMDERHFCFQRILDSPVLEHVPRDNLPACESLKDLVQRTIPFWVDHVGLEIRAGKRLLVVAHGTSLRGVVKYVKDLDEAAVSKLNLPTGIPFVMDIDKKTLKSTDGKMTFLADDETVRKATEKVSHITKT